MNLALAFEIVRASTLEQTKSSRLRKTFLCMRFRIAVHEQFVTTWCCTLKLVTSKLIFDDSIKFFDVEHRTASATGFFIALFFQPIIYTSSAAKTRAWCALNWVFHYEAANDADKVFENRKRLNDVFLFELVFYIYLSTFLAFQIGIDLLRSKILIS